MGHGRQYTEALTLTLATLPGLEVAVPADCGAIESTALAHYCLTPTTLLTASFTLAY